MFIVLVKCDVCKNDQQLHTGNNVLLPKTKVKTLLKDNGWLTKDGKEFCPECIKKIDRMQARIRKGDK